ncbi:hypothetical protein CB0940_08781 [Cercospora beticola]|uniref:Uncharacterized protein n=2 Tax=Cercospora TaxID=29002 RepID=A0A2G5HQH6_CERBT|nr:hypothetical protein CB0940_08781 [Cercospora beticola]XP_044659437.1 uncharacterized protein CKM354_000813400 [Cercospora kikuchii]PIA94778.1 hypothetical protein CB0940_08781 [Cercospora beticola]WPB05366.1 hypothetical protein RHO25_010018 [Cercospora beticola]CAK1365167.1 unnamed protein product [Cercospora beticola]GIZ44950.1 hypothetical protein CKM354_000813400 [Cercospora kikuchii]
MDKTLCLCFPCIISYLGGYIYPTRENQFYPALQHKGFTLTEQRLIAEEWYWVAFERETAVRDYLRGYVTFRDGCWWRPPPPPRANSMASTPSSASVTGSIT